MSNLIDRLMTADIEEISKDNTQEVEIERLSEITGEPFICTIKELRGKRFNEIISMATDKQGNKQIDKIYDMELLLLSEAIIEPNMKDKDLQSHFKVATPKELVDVLFKSAEVTKLSDACMKLQGYGEESDDEIKN